jgi:hypothetical protein
MTGELYLFTANTVVQHFLTMIASGTGTRNINMEADKMLIPLTHLKKVLALLVNPSVTEINCTLFDNIRANSQKFNNFLLKHSLENCPKISKIDFMNSKPSNKFDTKRNVLPIERFKKSWNDLKSIKTNCD